MEKKSPRKIQDKSLKSPHKRSQVTLIRADPVTCVVLVLLIVNATHAFLIWHKAGRERLKENIDKHPAQRCHCSCHGLLDSELNTFVLAHLKSNLSRQGCCQTLPSHVHTLVHAPSFKAQASSSARTRTNVVVSLKTDPYFCAKCLCISLCVSDIRCVMSHECYFSQNPLF